MVRRTVRYLSVSQSASQPFLPLPARYHKIHFLTPGRGEIQLIYEGLRVDPPRNPVLLLFSQRGTNRKDISHLSRIISKLISNEGK